MDPVEQFKEECLKRVKDYERDVDFKDISLKWIEKAFIKKYMYNFSWLGRPIIQLPQDILAMQEIIWKVKPDLIIETGIAHGGSIIFYASLLQLINKGSVIGIDIDIRKHNLIEIQNHSMYNRIKLIEGSSVSEEIKEQVYKIANGKNKILIVLDSNHTCEHVSKEIEFYAPLVTIGSYLVIFDTIVEDLPSGFFPDRPWDKGDNPKIAVRNFLRNNNQFVIDKEIENKLLITSAPNGYLRRIK